MKRITALLLAAVMLFTLAGCGDTADTEPTPEDGPQITAEPEPEAAGEPEPERPVGMPAGFDPSGTIEETVLVEESDVRITATELEYGTTSVSVRLILENNSDEELRFTSGTLGYSCNSINGMMVEDGYLNCDIAAGKKAIESVSFNYDYLRLYGIQEIADIELAFRITDKDYDHVDLPPCQLLTSLHEGYEYDPLCYQKAINGSEARNALGYELIGFTEEQPYDKDGIAVLSQALVENIVGDAYLFVEVENRGDAIRNLAVSNIVINNLIVSCGRWTTQTVAPGKRGLITVDLSVMMDDNLWAPVGIGSIGSAGFSLQQLNTEGEELTGEDPMEFSFREAAPIDMSGTELYNQNGVRLVLKGILEPEYSSDYTVLLLAENTGSEAAALKIEYNTMSVNGFMIDYFGSTWEPGPGQIALVDINFYDSNLEEIGVTEKEDIEEIEFELKISKGRSELDHPVLVLDLSGE